MKCKIQLTIYTHKPRKTSKKTEDINNIYLVYKKLNTKSVLGMTSTTYYDKTLIVLGAVF